MKKWLWAFAVLACAAGWTYADGPSDDLNGANDALQGKDKAKDNSSDLDDASNAARGTTAEDQEPELDPVQALNDIADKMKDAEAALHKAGSWKAQVEQKKAVEAITKLIKESKDNQDKSAAEIQKMIDEAVAKQQQAMDDAAKLMNGAGGQQQKALEEIEKLIKQAKETG